MLLVAGRIQAEKWLWPASEDRFLLVPIGMQRVLRQYIFVVGNKNTDALSGSIWQNTIPVFTLFMGLVSGLEKIAFTKPRGLAKMPGVAL